MDKRHLSRCFFIFLKWYNLTMKKILNMRHLKIIAYVTMLIDHIGAVIVENVMDNPSIYGISLSSDTLFYINMALRLIGRLAFPIFAFSIYEGFNKTRDIKKYMLRLFIFAVISEIPFDLAASGKFFDWSYQNVIWTFLFALMGLYIYEKYYQVFIKIFAIGATLALGELFHTDYGAYGVAIIYVFYFLKENIKLRNLILGAMFLYQATAILALVPLEMYNGQKGMKTGRILYYFYPGHLLILYLILQLMNYYLISG